MSYPSPDIPAPASVDTDRALGLVNYALLFFAHWLGFIPAIIAVAIAYARRGSAGAIDRTHYDFQIRTFWIGFWLGAAGVIAIILALVSGLGTALTGAGGFELAAVGLGFWMGLLVVAAVLLFLASFFWTLVASAFGFVKQLSGSPIGRIA